MRGEVAMRQTAVLLAVLTSLPVSDIVAQTAERHSLPAANWPQEFTQGSTRRPSLESRIASGIGGALLGAGLGFFASQVVQGDWQEGTEGQPINRSLWSVIGGSVGFAVGVRFPLGGRGGVSTDRLPMGREHLGPSALRGRETDNAYQAVALLRPEWLQIRGSQSLAPGIDPVVVSGTSRAVRVSGSTPLTSEVGKIQVYVDDVNIGGIEALRSIEVSNISDIYFFDAAEATLRWGTGNPHGAILIIT
jgi:hypothetical protein